LNLRPLRAGPQGLAAHEPLDAVQAALQPQRQHIVPDAPRTIGAVAADEALAHLCTQYLVVPLRRLGERPSQA